MSSILAPAGRGWATAHAEEPAPCAAVKLAPMKAFQASPGQAAKMSNDGAMLDIGASAVAAETAISITPLCDKVMPALDAGLTNVTKGPRHAYRFLPHGTRFKNKIKITLPYDERLIPEGFTAQDIKSFYFDEQTGSWRELERVMVDTQSKMIVSLSDHFTDMINGTIAVPDHPETLSYNPNSIKDIKNADPAAGINLIEPP